MRKNRMTLWRSSLKREAGEGRGRSVVVWDRTAVFPSITNRDGRHSIVKGGRGEVQTVAIATTGAVFISLRNAGYQPGTRRGHG
jgi:hypothetical protein